MLRSRTSTASAPVVDRSRGKTLPVRIRRLRVSSAIGLFLGCVDEDGRLIRVRSPVSVQQIGSAFSSAFTSHGKWKGLLGLTHAGLLLGKVINLSPITDSNSHPIRAAGLSA